MRGLPAPRVEFCRGAGVLPSGREVAAVEEPVDAVVARLKDFAAAYPYSGDPALAAMYGATCRALTFPGRVSVIFTLDAGHSPQPHVWGCWHLSVRVREGSGGRLPRAELEAWVRLFFPGLQEMVWVEPGLFDDAVAHAYVFVDRSRTPVDLVGDRVDRLVRLGAAWEGGATG